MTRRVWLQSILVAIWPRTAGPRLRTAAAANSSILAEAEIESLLAFTEAVVGGRPLSAEARSDLAAHLRETAASDPDRGAAYRSAARALDCLAVGRFSALGMSDRAALIGRHRLAGARAPSAGAAGRCRETDEIRSRVAPDLIAAYWRSSAGWAVVGYRAFPGRCGDLTRYTHRES